MHRERFTVRPNIVAAEPAAAVKWIAPHPTSIAEKGVEEGSGQQDRSITDVGRLLWRSDMQRATRVIAILIIAIMSSAAIADEDFRTVAITGDQVPGAAPGVTFSTFVNRGGVINSSGRVAFVARLTGLGVTNTNDIGIYREGIGTLAEVVRDGDPVPGSEPGIVFNGLTVSGAHDGLVFNGAGDVAFTAGLSGVGVNATNDRGIYREQSGILTQIVRENDSVPGSDSEVVFR